MIYYHHLMPSCFTPQIALVRFGFFIFVYKVEKKFFVLRRTLRVIVRRPLSLNPLLFSTGFKVLPDLPVLLEEVLVLVVPLFGLRLLDDPDMIDM